MFYPSGPNLASISTQGPLNDHAPRFLHSRHRTNVNETIVSIQTLTDHVTLSIKFSTLSLKDHGVVVLAMEGSDIWCFTMIAILTSPRASHFRSPQPLLVQTRWSTIYQTRKHFTLFDLSPNTPGLVTLLHNQRAKLPIRVGHAFGSPWPQ
jgi:hypothetical protein